MKGRKIISDKTPVRILKISQSETRIAYGGHVCKWIGTK
jgi:hypothetical protein